MTVKTSQDKMLTWATYLLKVIVEVVYGRLAIEAKVHHPAPLHDKRAIEEGECVGWRAMDGGTDGDASLYQAPHNAYHL